MTPDYNGRLMTLRQQIEADAIVLVPGSNLRYFTGLPMHLSERPTIALITREGIAFILPRLEQPTIDDRPDLNARLFTWHDAEGYMNAFDRAIADLGLRGRTLAVDGLAMRVTELLAFLTVDRSLGIIPVERDLTRIRAIKTPDEIAAMRQAIAISEAALAAILPTITPGMTERQIADRLDRAMRDGGAQGLAFETLVQSGANSANPHGVVSDRVLQDGELLLIDFGARFGGYPADITRTFLVGDAARADERLTTIHAVVAQANAAARAAVHPGALMSDIDRAARGVIEAAGFAEYFTHRTGHGIGLDVHEAIPQIASGVPDRLEPGMTFTIEPGIYLHGIGGCRIEDNMLVTEDGAEVLTRFRRDFAL